MRYPLFMFCEGTDNLFKAAVQVAREAGSIRIPQKNVVQDLEIIYKATHHLMAKHGLQMEHDTVIENDGTYFKAVLLHKPSGEQYTKSYLFADRPVRESKAFFGIKACIELLGLEIVNDEDLYSNLSVPSRDTTVISFTDIENYFKCIRCFYLAKKGIKMPFSGDEQFNIPNANDAILKQEFDLYRDNGFQHPIMSRNKIEAIPLQNTNIDRWRTSDYGNGGIRFFDSSKNMLFTGVIDDVWINQRGEFIVVDYKTVKELISLDDDTGKKYRRQISFYGWLFKQNGYSVHSAGYLIMDKPRIDLKFTPGESNQEECLLNPSAPADQYKRLMMFKTVLLPVALDYSWIESTLNEIFQCLQSDDLPKPSVDRRRNAVCATCQYNFRVRQFEDRVNKLSVKIK